MLKSYSYLKNEFSFRNSSSNKLFLFFYRFFFDIDQKSRKNLSESKHLKVISDQNE